jgi:hypothetical protein
MNEEGLTANETPFAHEEAHPGDPPPKPVNPVVPSGAVIVQGDYYVQHDQAPKRSHVCCGCCCDARKAIFVVNSISLTFGVLGIFSLAIATSSSYQAQIEDDEVQAAMNELDGAKLGMTIAIMVMGMICPVAGIYGASIYNEIGVIVAGVWYVAYAILGLVFFDVSAVVMSICFAYPHAVFYSEMKQGIMAPETYSQERQCCTCCG